MSNGQLECAYCKNQFPDTRNNCPHCARPQIFPNVTKATVQIERDKLETRFDSQKKKCEAGGRDDEFARFEKATANSHALFACPLLRLHREIASGTDIFETYYQLEELRLRSSKPSSLDWEALRPQTEIQLLGSKTHIKQLHYACLSLDWESLSNYGDCVVKLENEMIGHRASCFEGNSAVIYAVEGKFDHYLRSDWDGRGRICSAVLAEKLSKGTRDDEFAKLLVVSAADSVDDQFIEVHVFGTITAKSIAEVRFFLSKAKDKSAKAKSRDAVYREAITEKLTAVSVTVSEQGATP